MRKSLRSQDKSIYLAFALSPSIVFQSLFDRQQSQDRQFHFQLTKGNQTTEKTASFGCESMKRSLEMYLYLALPQYAQKLNDSYAIRLVEQLENNVELLYQESIDLNHYIQEHNTQEKDFWTQILKHSTETYKITIMQRVFLKRTRFQLDDIINSSEMGQELDVVDIPATDIKLSKVGIRKSKSYQSSSLNSLISPRRLETISEEDSTIPLTQRKERESIGESKHRPQRLSASVRKQEIVPDFENQLKKQSTWVQKNHHFDDQFFNVFEFKDHQNYKKSLKEFDSNPDQLKLKPLTQSQISQKGSKISKQTKDSEKQNEDNSISFLQKSSLLLDMSQSELSISPDDQMCFKLKWIVLVVIILILAVVASLSTDAFDITDSKKHKTKGHKKRAEKQKGKSKQGKSNKTKERKQVHV